MSCWCLHARASATVCRQQENGEQTGRWLSLHRTWGKLQTAQDSEEPRLLPLPPTQALTWKMLAPYGVLQALRRLSLPVLTNHFPTDRNQALAFPTRKQGGMQIAPLIQRTFLTSCQEAIATSDLASSLLLFAPFLKMGRTCTGHLPPLTAAGVKSQLLMLSCSFRKCLVPPSSQVAFSYLRDHRPARFNPCH